MEIGINAATRILENEIKQKVNKSGLPAANAAYAIENVMKEVKEEMEKQIEIEIGEYRKNANGNKKILGGEGQVSETDTKSRKENQEGK